MTDEKVKYGIAAQLALGDFLQARLKENPTGWEIEMTEPGSAADRYKGIDFYLVSPEGTRYGFDVSLHDKPGKLMLRMYDQWFTPTSREAFTTTNKLVVDSRRETEILEAVIEIVSILMTARR